MNHPGSTRVYANMGRRGISKIRDLDVLTRRIYRSGRYVPQVNPL